MIVTQDNIGSIFCRYDTGERFAIREVDEDGLSVQYEDGSYNRLASHVVFGGIEQEEARIASFQTNLSLSRVLLAAKAAAERRIMPGSGDTIERENATHVADVVNEQYAYLQSRMQEERQNLKAGRALASQFLAELAGQGIGSSTRFFDTMVQCREGPQYIFRINEIADLDQSSAEAFLSNRTLEPSIATPSLDERIKSATTRAKLSCQNSKVPSFHMELK